MKVVGLVRLGMFLQHNVGDVCKSTAPSSGTSRAQSSLYLLPHSTLDDIIS